jgi:hypothetical protein
MTRRQDEEFAKDAFGRFLIGLGIEHRWRGGTEPPAYFLDVGQASFPVEIAQVAQAAEVGSRESKWGAQIVPEVSELIHQAVFAETERLRAVPGERVLLLFDGYHLADPDAWQVSINWPWYLASPFHTIARVYGEFECQILHCRDGTWRAASSRSTGNVSGT